MSLLVERVEHATSVHMSHVQNCPVDKDCKYNCGSGHVGGPKADLGPVGVVKAHYHCDLCGKATDRPKRAHEHYRKKHLKSKHASTHARPLHCSCWVGRVR